MMVLELRLQVEGNINSAKYIDILDKNLWPVVVWYFEGKEYLSGLSSRAGGWGIFPGY